METPNKGNLGEFCEAEIRRQMLISKLHLKGNKPEFLICYIYYLLNK